MLPEAMKKFIKKHHVMTLSVGDAEGVWSAHCFYAYDSSLNAFVFTSDENTRHVKMFQSGRVVALSIALETRIIGKIQGIQMTGNVYKSIDLEYEKCKKLYLKRFPYAIVMKTTFWIFLPDYAKMTDNAFGFGKKLIWTGND